MTPESTGEYETDLFRYSLIVVVAIAAELQQKSITGD
jgi:hypothetical protein